MRLPLFFLLSYLLISSCNPTEPPNPEPDPGAITYLQGMIEVMRTHAYHREIIDWEAFERRAIEAVSSDPSLFTSIQLALGFLGDKSSFFRTTSGISIRTNQDICSGGVRDIFPLPPGIQYTRIPDFSQSQADNQTAANLFLETIQAVDLDSVNGWILDLRRNSSQSLETTLQAIGPFLRQESSIFSIGSSEETIQWKLQNNSWVKINSGGSFTTYTYNPPFLDLDDSVKIAILTNQETSKAAEAAVILLKDQRNIRVFGQPTCGQTAYLREFRLIDQSSLHLVTGFYADGKGNIYDGPITPDEIDFTPDKIWEKAVNWLNE
jgi:hypothetical protein